MTVPVVLSASSLQTFFRCGHQWYLSHVVRLREPPNVRQVIGVATHSAIEHNMIQKITSRSDVTSEEMEDVFASNYDSLVADVEKPDEDLGEAKDSGIKLVRLHRRQVSPTIQPVWVEKAGQLEIDGVPYSWVVDLADDQGRIRDTKTTVRRKRLEDYALQMTGYALGYRQETGQKETGIVIDALIRTKIPYYWKLEGGSVNDRAEQAFSDTVQAAYSAIESGNFVPNGLTNGACSWCGYARICKYKRG